MNVVQYTWHRQSRTEYMAAALTSQMLHWLITLGLNPDLLVRGARVVRDEIRHAAICHELYLHVGGEAKQMPVKPSQLWHSDDPKAPVHLRAITAAGELACEESVALSVFRARLENATDPMAREVCEVILRDEATHRAYAWSVLEALIALQGLDAVRDWARPRIAWWLRIYLTAKLRPNEPEYSPEQLGFGLIDRRSHWTMMRATVEEDVIPRFQSLGLLESSVTGSDLERELAAMRQG